MKKKIIIAPVNAESEEKPVFLPVSEFPTERMIYLASPDGIVRAEELRDGMEKLGISVSIMKIRPEVNTWEDYFVAAADALEGQDKERMIINISTADRISQCALTNAAHVNGIRAIAVIDGRMMLLPILKLSYSNMLSPKKVRILKALEHNKCYRSLDELSKSTNMSLQLVSYHLNGSQKSKGLAELELVETEEKNGRIKVCLSTMGRLFMRGYLD